MSRKRSNPAGNATWAIALARAMESSTYLRTQAALARRSGVAQSTIGRILRGEVNPQADNLERLARALRIPCGTFFDGVQVESLDSGAECSEPEDANWEQSSVLPPDLTAVSRAFSDVQALLAVALKKVSDELDEAEHQLARFLKANDVSRDVSRDSLARRAGGVQGVQPPGG